MFCIQRQTLIKASSIGKPSADEQMGDARALDVGLGRSRFMKITNVIDVQQINCHGVLVISPS